MANNVIYLKDRKPTTRSGGISGLVRAEASRHLDGTETWPPIPPCIKRSMHDPELMGWSHLTNEIRSLKRV